MTNLQARLDDLRRRLLESTGDQETLAQLEEEARVLLTDAKNTPHERATQALFAELARMSNPASVSSATVRGLLRRARIRIEIAGGLLLGRSSAESIDADKMSDAVAEGALLAKFASHANRLPERVDLLGIVRKCQACETRTFLQKDQFQFAVCKLERRAALKRGFGRLCPSCHGQSKKEGSASDHFPTRFPIA
jgi:hypothetical protein